MMRLFLIGMPGSGKTTVGKKLTKTLSIPFIDLDNFIEQEEGESVPEIFANKGEQVFRAIESEYLQRIILREENVILSCGGGTPVFNNNMELINSAGTSVFLNPPMSDLLSRLNSKERTSRPLFATLNLQEFEEKLLSMYQFRQPFYNKAQISIEETSIDEIIKKIEKGISSGS